MDLREAYSTLCRRCYQCNYYCPFIVKGVAPSITAVRGLSVGDRLRRGSSNYQVIAVKYIKNGKVKWAVKILNTDNGKTWRNGFNISGPNVTLSEWEARKLLYCSSSYQLSKWQLVT